MRVVMIGPFGLRPKGTMKVRALPMARALVKRGHTVKMILPPWDYPQDTGRKLQDAGVDIENVKLPASMPLLFHINTTRRLVKHALDFKPDAIHCFKPKAYAGLSAWWLWQMKRIGLLKARLIVDSDDWEGAGGWNDLSGQPSAVSGQYSWVQKKMFAWQEHWGLTHADAITVASRALQSIVWSLGVKREKIAYVPNGVQPSAVSGQQHLHRTQVQVSSMTILLYTRFFEFKVERVIEVMRRVIEQTPHAKLLVVGKGFFGEEEELLKQAGALRLRDHVEYAGWVPPEQLPELFARSSVAIFPFDDTLINRTKCAMKLIDLLATGVPVVADAVGQNVEYIKHNETGFIVPSGDVGAMAQAVIDLLHDRDRAAQLGANAARDVCDRFSWDRLVEIVEQIYKG